VGHFHLATAFTDAPANLHWSVAWGEFGTDGSCSSPPTRTGTAEYIGNTLVGGTEPTALASSVVHFQPLSVSAPGYGVNFWSHTPDAAHPEETAPYPCRQLLGLKTWFAHFVAAPEPAATATTLASSPNPSVYGDDVVLTATVTSQSVQPTGTVSFVRTDGGGPVTVCADVSLVAASAACDLGTGLAPGAAVFHAVYTPADPDEFSASSSGDLLQQVGKLGQVITFAGGEAGYGDADFDPDATASSGLPVSYASSTPAVCTIVSGLVHVVAVGDCEVTASQDGNAIFSAAEPVTRTIVVSPVEPGAPPAPVATAGNAEATVAFSPPAFDGGAEVTSYTVISSPGGHTASGASSPITVTGLTNGTSYTFTVTATNGAGTGPASAPSNAVVPTAPASSALLYLHGIGATANPAVLTLDEVAPTASTPKYSDSASIKFAGGNAWKTVGTWGAAPAAAAGTLTGLGDLHVWLGLKNSDDQGTSFDLRAEVSVNGQPVSSGLVRAITGVTRNPSLAKEVAVPFEPFAATALHPGDVVTVSVSTRIGTNPDGTKAPGHANATGLRLYHDAAAYRSQLATGFGG
jgi:hypothetical protein